MINDDDGLEKEEHRRIGVKCYNRCWVLLDKETRTLGEDDELVELSFVQHYHWAFAGGEEQLIMANWMVSRAAAATGHDELALRYAELAYQGAQSSTTPDWLRASVAEGMARAYAAHGDESKRDHWYGVAEKLVALIGDREDRELIASQLESVPR